MKKSCVTLIALGIAAFAVGQEPLPPFDEVDSNQDGRIGRTEAAAVEGLDLDAADSNHDGSLDRTEYMAAARSQGQEGSSGESKEPGRE